MQQNSLRVTEESSDCVRRQLAGQVARWSCGAGTAFAVLYGAGWWVLPRLFTSSSAVWHQAHLLWPWFVAILPAAGVVFGLDGVLIGAGDVAFMRTLTIVAALGGFVPLTLAAAHWHWGIGGVWAGLTAFIAVRLVGMVLQAQAGHEGFVAANDHHDQKVRDHHHVDQAQHQQHDLHLAETGGMRQQMP